MQRKVRLLRVRPLKRGARRVHCALFPGDSYRRQRPEHVRHPFSSARACGGRCAGPLARQQPHTAALDDSAREADGLCSDVVARVGGGRSTTLYRYS